LDVDLAALLQVLPGDLTDLSEQLDPMPLGFFDLLAVLVLAHAGCGQAQGGDRHAALGVLGFRIVAEIADEDHLVDAACHGCRSWFVARNGRVTEAWSIPGHPDIGPGRTRA